ncbi:MAG: hypothetical protein ACYC6C_07610 [Coriobacteriia bacterium]
MAEESEGRRRPENSDLLVEYQAAQESAQHHDHLVASWTSIVWSAVVVLLGLAVPVVAGGRLPVLMTLVAVLAILLLLWVLVFALMFGSVKRQKYERCKQIESELGLHQHTDLNYPRCVQSVLYVVMTLLFIGVLSAVIVFAWSSGV